MDKEFPIYINGEWCKTQNVMEICAPFDGQLVGSTYRAGEQDIEKAIVSGVEAFDQTRHMPAYEKSEKLFCPYGAAARRKIDPDCQVVHRRCWKRQNVS